MGHQGDEHASQAQSRDWAALLLNRSQHPDPPFELAVAVTRLVRVPHALEHERNLYDCATDVLPTASLASATTGISSRVPFDVTDESHASDDCARGKEPSIFVRHSSGRRHLSGGRVCSPLRDQLRSSPPRPSRSRTTMKMTGTWSAARKGFRITACANAGSTIGPWSGSTRTAAWMEGSCVTRLRAPRRFPADPKPRTSCGRTALLSPRSVTRTSADVPPE